MPNNNETTTRFKVDISELKSQFQEASRQIKLANSEFKAATSGMDNWSKSADGISAKIRQLNSVLDAQKSQLSSLEKQYELTVKEQGKNSKGAQELMIKINNQKAAIGNTEKQIKNYNNQLIEMQSASEDVADEQKQVKSAMDKLKETISKQESELEELKTQYSNVVLEQGKSSNAAKELSSKIEALSTDLKNNKSKLDDAQYSTEELSDSQDKAKTSIDKLKDSIKKQEEDLVKVKDQYSNLILEQGESSDEAKELAKQIDSLSNELNNNKNKLNDAEKAADEFDNSLNDVEENSESATDGFTIMRGALADLVASGIKAAIQEFKNLVSAARDAYEEFDVGYDNLIKATGATSKTAKDLEKSYKNVAKSVKSELSTLGSTVGEVNTRFGYTGKQLEETTIAFVKFADISGTDATRAVQLVSRAMGDAGIDSSEYASVLDNLAVAAQASGISVDTLTGYLTKYGAPMRALGFDTKESIAIFSQWEKAGVNTEIAFSGMKNAISKWSSEEKDAKKEFKKTLNEIGKTPKIADATSKAIEVFGKKAGPDLADAIKGGRFVYSDFLTILENSEGTVEKTYKQTQDGFDKINLAVQALKTDVGNAFKNMIDEFAPEIEKIIEKIKKVLDKTFKTFNEKILPKIIEGFTWISEHSEEIEAGVIGIAAAFTTWKFVSVITAVSTALAGMSAAEVLLAAKTWLLNTALMSNPIGLIIAAIAGLVAAFVVLWKKCDWFRNFWIDLWEKIKQTVIPVFEKIKEVFTEIWEAMQPIIEQIKIFLRNAFAEIKDMFSSAWEAIKAIWDFVAPYFSAIWQRIKNTFSVAKEVLGRFFKAAWEIIKVVWDIAVKYFTTIWKNIKVIFSAVKTVLSGFFNVAWEAIKAIWNNVTGYFKMIWNNIKAIFSVVASVFRGDFSGAWEGIKSIWNNVVGYFQTVWNGVRNVFAAVVSFFKNSFSDAWNAVKSVFANVGDFFSGVWDIIKSKFSTVGTAIGDAIGYAFKTAINSVISMVENSLNFIPNAVNGALHLINKLPGVEIPSIPLFNLPRLARGGVLKKGQMGLLEGNGAEAVVPLEKNTKWLDEIANRLYTKLDLPKFSMPQKIDNSTINNFYQTNNSPKPLSRLEIYRQSKNLLAMKR